MIFVFFLFMLSCGYYTFTFGISQYQRKNRLGGTSTMVVAVIGTLLPAIVLYIKNR